MKLSKKLLVTAALLTAAVVSFAQSSIDFYQQPASSLMNEKTAGLFKNEFDKQFTANLDFGTYSQQFLYGGLGNPRKDKALLNGSPTIPNIMLGYYRPGAKPMSVFGDWGAEDAFSRAGSTKTTAGGVTTTTTPLGIFLFKKYTTHLQFLTGLGGEKNVVIGGQFFLYSDFNNLNPEHFMKTQVKGGASDGVTEQWNFNLADILNAAPAIPESKHNFEIGVPIALKTGNIEHGARISLNSHITEKNGSYKTTVGSKKERKITDMTAYTKIRVDYAASIPVRDKEEDRWIIGGDVEFGLAGQSYEQKNTNMGAALPNIKQTYKPSAGGGFALHGGRLFNFHPGDGIVFKVRPGVRFGYNGAHNTDFTAAGVMKNPKPWHEKTVTNGATTFTGSKPKQWMSAHQVVSGFELPMGITVKPEKWVCGFMLGVTPAVAFATNIAYDELNNATDPFGKRTITVLKPQFTESHVVGLNFEFNGGVRLDVYATGDLTELNKFTAQVFIPLGVPKAKSAAKTTGNAKSGAAKKN